MNDRLKTALWVVAYAFVVGLLLTIFAQMTEFYRYLFSLLALYIGIRYFRRFETLGLRITFFALAIVFYLLTTVVMAIFIYVRENPATITGV
ncbi:putative membrane protein [Paenibacillus castaneae]|uniref:hypothetical protein n=1 Tax=Paenibacillus castaneae TaxID=474957 RepID=UPI000C9D0ABB|nr:hypothetical protein [Paenibacillus castaneae]NIK75712.1 putative membrane protein [Paenibacillus castaneae]